MFQALSNRDKVNIEHTYEVRLIPNKFTLLEKYTGDNDDTPVLPISSVPDFDKKIVWATVILRGPGGTLELDPKQLSANSIDKLLEDINSVAKMEHFEVKIEI
jgi:hypothetical protein